MAMIRDAATGEILAFGRGGSARVSPSGSEVRIELSTGLNTGVSQVLRWR
jgi:hypothetical protein